MPKKVVFLISIAAVAAAAYFLFVSSGPQDPVRVASFEECISSADSVIMESYPRQCRTSDGFTFVEPIEEEEFEEIEEPKEEEKENKKIFGECVVSGCSGQVCSDEAVMTTCEYREEYACYRSATCETQENGECGWTMTNELEQCLKMAR